MTYGDLGGPNAGGTDIFLAHYDSAGTQLWVRQIGTASDEYGGYIEPDGAGGVLWTGHTFGGLVGAQRGGGDIILAGYDSAGNQVWIRQFGSLDYDYPTGLSLTPAGTILFTGVSWGDLWGTNLGSSDALLGEFDPIVNTLLWSTQFGTATSDTAKGAAISDDVLFAAGATYGSLFGATFGSQDPWIARFGGCMANCDGSTAIPALNVSDFICFQPQFAAGAPAANCDGSTTAPTLNVSDFVCFLVRYAVGCP